MSRYYEYEENIRGPRRDRDRDHSPDSNPGRHSKDSFVRETMTLEPPPGHPSSGRPRSVPPPDSRAMVPRGRSPSPRYYGDDDDYSRSRRDKSRDRSESPLSRARSAMQDNFTNSTAGIGASLIGAIAGGYAARQVSERVSENRRAKDHHGGHRRRSDADKDERMRLASTLVGAAIGGLGANVLTNRFEDSRERDRAQQQAWEGRYGRESDLPHYDTGRPSDLDHRSGRGWRGRDSDDDDYDMVYDRRSDNDRRRSHRRDSEDDDWYQSRR
ncbi:hypothetical protein ACO1O0_002426 [Amphichorda felina]